MRCFEWDTLLPTCAFFPVIWQTFDIVIFLFLLCFYHAYSKQRAKLLQFSEPTKLFLKESCKIKFFFVFHPQKVVERFLFHHLKSNTAVSKSIFYLSKAIIHWFIWFLGQNQQKPLPFCGRGRRNHFIRYFIWSQYLESTMSIASFCVRAFSPSSWERKFQKDFRWCLCL